MACPFAQLSPLLLLSFLALFIQYGASFFLSKPLAATLHRGRSFSGASRKGRASPPPRHSGRTEGSDGRKSGVPRMLGVGGGLLAPPDSLTDLNADPFPWTESLSGGGPLLYSGMLRWQASALQLGLGLDRLACPSGMDAVCNTEKKSRVRNLVYAGERVRKLRMSYLDTPGMQVFSSVAYSTGSHDFPLLGVSAMAMGRVRVLALDLQPLFTGPEYAEKYAYYTDRMATVRERYPQMGQELQKDYYKGSPFFSDNMLYARWGPEEEANGFMDSVVMPAFQECLQIYIDLVSEAPAPTHAPGSPAEKAILERQAEFDRFHAEREQVRPVMTANFGAAWAEEYVSEFLFSYQRR